MFDIEFGGYRDCEGFSRRNFIRVGSLSAFGLSLPGLLRAESSTGSSSTKRDPACILLWMGGGPSHIDTFDPKPNAPLEFRGIFKPISTKVPGVHISEHFPKLAQTMDKFSIIRSVTSPDGNHETATHYLLTGYPFNPSVEYPGYGSVLAREKGFANEMPPYAIFGGMPGGHGGGGYMGSIFNPLNINGDPNNPDFSVEDLSPPSGIDTLRLDRRKRLRSVIDNWQRKKESAGQTARNIDEFYVRARNLVSSPVAKKAFDLKDEPDNVRDEYGRNTFGQSCLLARRLVEAGVRCVTISFGSWDTHADNFNTLKDTLMPPLDSGYSALLKDLHQRGMMESTLVVCMGEFGRTPRVNSAAGRDHWPGAISVCIGGGGLKTGVVVGSSNERGEAPSDRPLRVEDVAATIYRALGIDSEKQYMSPQQRPLKINYDGTPIRELL